MLVSVGSKIRQKSCLAYMYVNGGDTWFYESHHVCITCTFSFRFVCQGNQITKNFTNYYNFFLSTTLSVASHKFFFAYVSKMRKTIAIGCWCHAKKCWRDNLTDVTKPRYVTRAFLFISSPAIRFTWAEKGRPTYKHPATPLPLVLQRKPVRRLFISQSPLRIPLTSFSFQ